MNYLPGLALNCDPSDFCLLSSWDYRHEPPDLALTYIPGLVLDTDGGRDSRLKKNDLSRNCRLEA
jgi:hypothetical protein